MSTLKKTFVDDLFKIVHEYDYVKIPDFRYLKKYAKDKWDLKLSKKMIPQELKSGTKKKPILVKLKYSPETEIILIEAKKHKLIFSNIAGLYILIKTIKKLPEGISIVGIDDMKNLDPDYSRLGGAIPHYVDHLLPIITQRINKPEKLHNLKYWRGISNDKDYYFLFFVD